MVVATHEDAARAPQLSKLPVGPHPVVAPRVISVNPPPDATVALPLAVITVTVRTVTAEAISLRLGVFVYVFVSALILLLLFVVGGLGFLSNTAYAFVPLLMAHGALLAGQLASQIFYMGGRLTDFRLA